MPFDEELRDVYLKGIKETLEGLGWTCHRADEKFDAPEIVCTICKSTQEANLIIADLTGKNPNVFLETGLAFGLEKYVAFLSQNLNDVPFDTKTFRTILYDPQKLSDLKQKIQILVQGIKFPQKVSSIIGSFFENRIKELERVKDIPSEPLVELFIGPTRKTQDWLHPNPENLQLMRCIPDSFRNVNVIGRRKYFEFENRKAEIFVRMHLDGFFHSIKPWGVNSDEQGTYTYLFWLMVDIAESLFFVVRILKKYGIETEQNILFKLKGIAGLKVVPYSIRHRFLISRSIRSFADDEDTISYEKIFNSNDEWNSFYRMLCDIYKEICVDLGIFDLREEVVSSNIRKVITNMQSLRTTYSGCGLNSIPLKEIFGESWCGQSSSDGLDF